MLRLLLIVLAVMAAPALACGGPATVCADSQTGALALIDGGRPIRIVTDPVDDAGVLRAARDLTADFQRIANTSQATGKTAVIAGTIGRNPLIDRLVREGKLDTSGVAGQWEAYLHQVVDNPAPGIDRALVIAGADRRGTIFGIYDLSQAIGVSPWYWWADVPPRRRDRLFVLPGRRIDKPAVRYRGIFINDEDPALLGWVKHTFGGFNHAFYEKVFELILRQRGNYLWPAMWGKSFYEDDTENARLATEMGVVIGTSHHEPLMRAHVDWEHHGTGPWDYTKNAERLRAFWREGMQRTQGTERVVTIGMRGDGDEPMTQGTAIPLLERIVADQRAIIADVTGKPAEQTPQVWALYKEVQDYYDQGMQVPDDVTLLFSDDNWGNIRRLPKPGATRAGGYGVYYHFDYVGGPRNYKWINTTQIERVWEQMRLAYASGADRLWIVNVGDIKPMEFPINFFLDYAWNPDAMPLERLTAYPRDWAARQFGEAHAAEIGELLTRYARYAARRKPELVDAETYSLDAFGEADRVIGEWDALERKAEALKARLPQEQHDAYFELVQHPIMANANLHRMYVAVAKARRGDAAAAAEARRLYARDAEISRMYEVDTAGGKWTQMMAQTHIGYTSWQQPERDVMPALDAAPQPRAAPAENNYAAVEAAHFRRAIGPEWRVIPNLGVTAQSEQRGAYLEYDVRLPESGDARVEVTLAPTLDFRGDGGLRYAVSIDEQPPQTVNVNGNVSDADWRQAAADNRWVKTTSLGSMTAGKHRIRLWLIDPGLVFQRLVVATGPIQQSHLGPPETAR